MKEYRNASGGLAIELSDEFFEFSQFAQKMTARYGLPVAKVNGPGQYYWDFDVNGVLVTLHADDMMGVSIHLEKETDETTLRRVAGELTSGLGQDAT